MKTKAVIASVALGIAACGGNGSQAPDVSQGASALPATLQPGGDADAGSPAQVATSPDAGIPNGADAGSFGSPPDAGSPHPVPVPPPVVDAGVAADAGCVRGDACDPWVVPPTMPCPQGGCFEHDGCTVSEGEALKAKAEPQASADAGTPPPYPGCPHSTLSLDQIRHLAWERVPSADFCRDAFSQTESDILNHSYANQAGPIETAEWTCQFTMNGWDLSNCACYPPAGWDGTGAAPDTPVYW